MSDEVEVVFVEEIVVEEIGRGWRLVTFEVDVGLIKRLDALARRMGKSRSEVIKKAIAQ